MEHYERFTPIRTQHEFIHGGGHGPPTVVSSAASITIQASNSGGSDSTTISITVNDEAPNIAYSGSPFTFTKDNTINTITPSNTGGASSSWSITSIRSHPASA